MTERNRSGIVNETAPVIKTELHFILLSKDQQLQKQTTRKTTYSQY